jgi:hypothetical protein
MGLNSTPALSDLCSESGVETTIPTNIEGEKTLGDFIRNIFTRTP